jgi:hypothetical protein
MIEPAQVHQLVNDDVVAHRIGHQHEPPIQTDVSFWRTRSPAPPLIANADLRNHEPVSLRQFVQSRWKFARSTPSQFLEFRRAPLNDSLAAFFDVAALPLDPAGLLFGKLLGVSPRSPARDGHANAPIGPYANDIATCPRMADEIYLQIQRSPPKVSDMVLRHES